MTIRRRPLTPTLSPQGRGEGVGLCRFHNFLTETGSGEDDNLTWPTDEPYITYVVDTQASLFPEIESVPEVESMSVGVRVVPFAGLGVLRPIAWLLVFFGIACSVESVSASCGDYLHPSSGLHPASGFAGMNHVDGSARHEVNGIPQPSQSNVLDAQSSESDSSSSESDSSIPVCSGPFCRQSVPVPLQRPEPEFRDPTSKDSWICFNQSSLVDDRWVPLDRPFPISLSEPHSGRIDRPPQVA